MSKDFKYVGGCVLGINMHMAKIFKEEIQPHVPGIDGKITKLIGEVKSKLLTYISPEFDELMRQNIINQLVFAREMDKKGKISDVIDRALNEFTQSTVKEFDFGDEVESIEFTSQLRRGDEDASQMRLNLKRADRVEIVRK